MTNPPSDSSPSTPEMGGGLSVIQYWAEKTLSDKGPRIWQTLLHKSACLSCAWGTGGQKGGFVNEAGEGLQRCAKSVEAIAAELLPAVPDDVFAQATLADLQQLTSEQADRLGRLHRPLIRRAGSDRYEPIAWEEVYRLASDAFHRPPNRVASYSSGRSSNEAAFLLQLMMRAMGSNNLADCSDLCHAPSTTGLKAMFGSGTSMVSLEDLKHTDCVVLIGSNAPANHPRLMNELIKLRDRGGQIIVVNPVVEVGLVKFGSPAFPIKSLVPGSAIASLYLQLIPGSDVALFVGIQKALIEQGLLKTDYLNAHTDGWQAVVAHAEATKWEAITATCGLSQTEITTAATVIGTATHVVFAWAMGATQHSNAVDNIYSIANTALLIGQAGKPGAGTMPIRGHSNVQGFGSMGVMAKLREEIRVALEHLLQRPLSRVPGYDTRALIEAADRGEVDTLLCLGGNLYAANPDLTQAKRALSRIKTIIYLATKPNVGHFHGLAEQTTLILPVFNRFENPYQTTTESGNNFVRLNDPGKTHLNPANLVAEVDFLAEIAHRIHGYSPVNWRQLRDPKYVRQLIAQTIPGFEQMASIDETQTEFTISGRILHQPHFPTDSGRAQLFVTPLPQLELPEAKSFDLSDSISERGIVLALMTGRSYSQHNTVVYKPGDHYRGMPHRHCILMHPDDAKTAGFVEHQRVTVQGNAGKMENVEIIYGTVRSGSALMFYPEVNAIFRAKVDPQSGTPAFKRVPILVYSPDLDRVL